MRNYLFAILALGILTTQNSCKKETATTPFCKATFWNLGSQKLTFTYDAEGFIKRSTGLDGSYSEYTKTGSLLVRQSYNSSGVPVGSSSTQTLNASGYIAVTLGFDTTSYTYNTDGQVTGFITRKDTVKSRVVITYKEGDVLSVIEYRRDSTVKSLRTFEYTDQENHSNLNILYDLLDSRLGKPAKHFVKRITTSTSSNELEYLNFYYTFDEQGSATTMQLLRQPENTVSDFYFGYNCE